MIDVLDHRGEGLNGGFLDVDGILRSCGKDVIYSQDLGYSILGLRILNPGNLVLGLRFKDPES